MPKEQGSDENAKWGEPLWGEIDTAIRHYDKLVVICSQHSLQSPPVIREIERALQKEDREHKNILFPIRIDDYLLDGWDHPRKADVVNKVIGDFRGWENHATYAKAFPRFLDALNRPQQAPKTGQYRAATPQPKSWSRSRPERPDFQLCCAANSKRSTWLVRRQAMDVPGTSPIKRRQPSTHPEELAGLPGGGSDSN